MSDNPVRIARAQGANPTRKGFSLVEVAVATAIVGMGIAAILVSVESGTRVNDAGKKLTQAIFLAQEVEHHLHGGDSRYRVGHILARVLWSRAVDGFKHGHFPRVDVP